MFASPIKQSGQGRRQLTVQNLNREEYNNISHLPSNKHEQRPKPADPVTLPEVLAKADVKLVDRTPPKPTSIPNTSKVPIDTKPSVLLEEKRPMPVLQK